MSFTQPATQSTHTRILDILLNRFQQGDRRVQNEIVRYSQSRLRLLVHKMLKKYPNVRRQEDTSDVLQNVWLRINRTLQNIKVETSVDLLRLASLHIRYELIDLARHHAAHPLALIMNLEQEDQSSDPAHLNRWSEIHEYIHQLPADERDLFDLLFYQGLTQEQAAALLSLSLRTLKRHWVAARLKLVQWLGDEIPL